MHLNYTLTVELRYSDLRIIFCNVILKKLNVSQLFTLYPPSLSQPLTPGLVHFFVFLLRRKQTCLVMFTAFQIHLDEC
jgi:hypothetical protein